MKLNTSIAGAVEGVVFPSVEGGVASIAVAFLRESLEHMVPWFIVTCAVIVCDLVFGIRCSLLTGERVRFSSAVRRTMGKMVTYFAFVAMVCTICVAAGGDTKIDVYSCLLVCFIEGCSILSNLLRPKGYDFNVLKAFGLFGKKLLDVEKEEMEGIITKGNKEETQG